MQGQSRTTGEPYSKLCVTLYRLTKGLSNTSRTLNFYIQIGKGIMTAPRAKKYGMSTNTSQICRDPVRANIMQESKSLYKRNRLLPEQDQRDWA